MRNISKYRGSKGRHELSGRVDQVWEFGLVELVLGMLEERGEPPCESSVRRSPKYSEYSLSGLVQTVSSVQFCRAPRRKPEPQMSIRHVCNSQVKSFVIALQVTSLSSRSCLH